MRLLCQTWIIGGVLRWLYWRALGIHIWSSPPPPSHGSGVELCYIRDERFPGRRRTDIEREKIAMAQDDRRKDYKTRCTVSWIIGEYDNLILSNGDALRKLRLLDMSDAQIKRLIPGLILDQKETK